jgi:hypothetical protein
MGRTSHFLAEVTELLAVVLVAAWCASPLSAGEGKKADRPPRHEKAAEAKRPAAAEKMPASPAAHSPAKSARKHDAAKTPQRPLAVRRQAIEAALEQTTQFEFTEEPFANLVRFLRDYHRIEVQIDAKALDDIGVATDSPVTVNLTGVSLRSALNLILRQLGLVFTIHDEVLLITTPDQRDSEYLTVEVYDVADLVACRDEKGQPLDDYDTVIELITTQIEPTSWDAVGGPASISPAPLGSAKAIVVTHHSEVHYRIEQLLARIRDIGAKSKGSGQPPTRSRPEPKKDRGGKTKDEGAKMKDEG